MRKTGKEMADLMSNYLNSMGRVESEFIETLSDKHRTLQQNFTRICVAWFKELDKNYKEGRYDGRNEASCILANKIMSDCKDETYLPFI